MKYQDAMLQASAGFITKRGDWLVTGTGGENPGFVTKSALEPEADWEPYEPSEADEDGDDWSVQ